MNQVWAKQEFIKRARLGRLDREKLADFLFAVSCQTERHEWETSEYNGIGYEVTKRAEYRPTELAKKAYELLTSTWKKPNAERAIAKVRE